MSYETEKRVREDMKVTKSCPGGRHIFTGGASVLKFPFTISFMCEGDYTIHIDKGQVIVNKVEKEETHRKKEAHDKKTLHPQYKKEAIENHRKMWNWIADETKKREAGVTKVDYLNENSIVPDNLPNQCYACEYATEYMHANDIEGARVCDYCPLAWPEGHGCSNTDNTGLYDRFGVSVALGDWKNSEKYARKIANLPERNV